MPTPITINGTRYNVPQSWAECTTAQYISAAALAQYQWQLNEIIENKKTTPEHLAYTQNAKRDTQLTLLYLMLNAPMRTFKALSPEQALDLFSAIAWIDKKTFPLDVKIKQFRHRNTLYNVHKKALMGWYLQDYILAEADLKRVLKKPTKQNTAAFIARICSTPTNRKPSPNLFLTLPNDLAAALVFQFIGALEALAKRFPKVFNGAEGESKPQGNHWADVISQVLLPKFGSDIVRARQATLYDAMQVMNDRAKEVEQQKNSSNKLRA